MEITLKHNDDGTTDIFSDGLYVGWYNTEYYAKLNEKYPIEQVLELNTERKTTNK